MFSASPIENVEVIRHTFSLSIQPPKLSAFRSSNNPILHMFFFFKKKKNIEKKQWRVKHEFVFFKVWKVTEKRCRDVAIIYERHPARWMEKQGNTPRDKIKGKEGGILKNKKKKQKDWNEQIP